MPRKPRFYMPGVPVHIVQRGNNKEAIFFAESDYAVYLDGLKEALKRYECQLHAYVLMTNHVHLLVTPNTKEAISRMMQYIGRSYVPYINHRYNRTGTLWEGRYKSSLVQDEVYLLACMRYIELNPVRANMVKTASDYRWSSYPINALGRNNELIAAHPLYLSLGKDESSRNKAYRSLFAVQMNDNQTEEIRAAWQTGTPLANDCFKAKIEKTLKTRVGYMRRDRPKKEA